MHRLILLLTLVGIPLLLVIPLFEQSTVIEKICILAMVAVCFMIQIQGFVMVYRSRIHVDPFTKAKDILHRYPEYRHPRKSHRKEEVYDFWGR